MSQPVTVVVEVFEESGCCGGGCGGGRTRFAGDLAWLEEQGATVTRHELGTAADSFQRCEPVRKMLETHGPSCLPIVVVDGAIAAVGAYPNRARLAALAGAVVPDDDIDAAANGGGLRPPLDQRAATLIALGAAVAADCEPALRAHFAEAERLGISREAICAAINVAISTKATAAKTTFDLAQGLLVPESAASGCCGGQAPQGEGGCCRERSDSSGDESCR